MKNSLTCFACLFLIAALPSVAATINVPGDQPTIQAGIDLALDGDTVLVADGTYTGEGNWNIDFHGKAVTLISANGRDHCTIDLQGHWGFQLDSGEGPGSVIQGFTIANGSRSFPPGSGGAIYCGDASPSILDNSFIDNVSPGDSGGAIACGNTTVIRGNYFSGNWCDDDGGALSTTGGSPLVLDNVFYDNESFLSGGAIGCWGGSPLIINNLIVGNRTDFEANDIGGGGISCYYGAFPELINCTLADNDAGWIGGAVFVDEYSGITCTNCVLWNNTSIMGFDQISGMSGGMALVEYSDVMGGWSGTGNIDSDPLFVTGPGGDYLLSQTSAGQAVDSPCLDTGNGPADDVCYQENGWWTCLHQLTTRSDRIRDLGTVDMGYHAAAWSSVGASFTCTPASGTLPFSSLMTATLFNHYPDMTRKIAARIDIDLAGGASFASWRAGYTNIAGGSNHVRSWMQYLPPYATLRGDNRFTLIAEDVTPAPYNQPPYPPAGSSAYDLITVTGYAP